MKTVWTIAGIDSCGYSGIHADCRAFHSLGLKGGSIVTAITAQNFSNISSIEYVSANHLHQQLYTLFSERPPSAIKIGMLAKPNANLEILNFLKRYPCPLVLDPVMIASSGSNLFANKLSTHLKELKKLLPLADVVTPNLCEAEILLNCRIHSYEQMEDAARKILQLGAQSVFLKGGHCADTEFSQDFWTNGKESFWLSNLRQPHAHYRGTGCTLSASIAASLAKGYSLKDSLVIAKMFINQSLRLADKISEEKYSLNYATWPENQMDMPYLTAAPLKNTPKPFKASPTLGLYPIVDSVVWVQNLLSLGVKTIQLRIKNKLVSDLVPEMQKSIYLAKKFGALLFINDHWALALQMGAEGVHLGQEDISQADVNAIKQAGLMLGISTHCYYEVAKAHAIGPSYMACGPIYPTTSKIMPFPPQGIQQLQRWQRTLAYPLVAIGGIDLSNIHEVLACKVAGTALISAISKAPDYRATTLQFLNFFKSEQKHAASE